MVDKIVLQSLCKLYEREIAKMEIYCQEYLPLTADCREATDELNCLREFYHKLVKKLATKITKEKK